MLNSSIEVALLVVFCTGLLLLLGFFLGFPLSHGLFVLRLRRLLGCRRLLGLLLCI